ncbi:hypothetical protein HPB48_006779 [Haemaphysalis longicornis]|uniref:Uncharacterized protein n=1 Tax=Haemaphysalis longicornis TaxID=44386 RepID=A0A9J6FLV2_HAELO|nr:hypothetical protein HPB48_006779 [Haemaphysalis longicornis]
MRGRRAFKRALSVGSASAHALRQRETCLRAHTDKQNRAWNDRRIERPRERREHTRATVEREERMASPAAAAAAAERRRDGRRKKCEDKGTGREVARRDGTQAAATAAAEKHRWREGIAVEASDGRGEAV